MKKAVISLLMVMLVLANLSAQDKLPVLDKSPLDISYFPNNYPIALMSGSVKGPLIARVIYSRPSVNGRKIFGGLVEYGKVWRLGANETTEIEFFKDVYVGKNKIKKGRYSLFVIPSENKWTFIFNKDLYCWGAFNYDAGKDLLRYDVSIEKTADPVEYFTLFMDGNGTAGFSLNVYWENTKVVLPFSVK